MPGISCTWQLKPYGRRSILTDYVYLLWEHQHYENSALVGIYRSQRQAMEGARQMYGVEGFDKVQSIWDTSVYLAHILDEENDDRETRGARLT